MFSTIVLNNEWDFFNLYRYGWKVAAYNYSRVATFLVFARPLLWSFIINIPGYHNYDGSQANYLHNIIQNVTLS